MSGTGGSIRSNVAWWDLRSARLRVIVSALAAAVAGLSLAACGDTLQDRPIASQPFESVIVKSRFPVYWVGLRFSKLRATNVTTDPGGAVTIQYGDCLVGGQYTCVTPLSIVTSPDNSFVPGGFAAGPGESAAGPGESAAASSLRLRGVRASLHDRGMSIALATGGVVVSVYAHTAALARAAAQTMTPLNESVLPSTPLPKPRPDTGFERMPLPSQLPSGAS